MKLQSGEKRIPSFRWCLLVYLCLTGVNLVIHNRLIDSQAPFIEKRQELHQQVLQNKAPAPIQYRIIAYYAAAMFQKMGVSFENSYLLFRGISIFLAAWIFHLFLIYYFPVQWSFIGVVYLLACMPMTYINYYMQEADALNLFFYILAFIIIRSRKDRLLFPLLAISMLNRETPVLVPLIWLLYRWDEMPPLKTGLKFFGYMAVVFGVYALLRVVFGSHESYSEFFYLKFNLQSFNSYLYFFLFFGPFLYLIFKDKGERPKFVTRTLLFLPFFIIFHMTIPIFQEARLILPLFPIVITAALCFFYHPEDKDRGKEHTIIRLPFSASASWYITMIAVFILQMWGFIHYVEKAHVGAWRGKDSVEKALKQGNDYTMQQNFAQAIASYEEGLKNDPNNFELHYYIARLSTYYVKDKNKALFHWNKCIQINPDDSRMQEILDGIGKLKQNK